MVRKSERTYIRTLHLFPTTGTFSGTLKAYPMIPKELLGLFHCRYPGTFSSSVEGTGNSLPEQDAVLQHASLPALVQQALPLDVQRLVFPLLPRRQRDHDLPRVRGLTAVRATRHRRRSCRGQGAPNTTQELGIRKIFNILKIISAGTFRFFYAL